MIKFTFKKILAIILCVGYATSFAMEAPPKLATPQPVTSQPLNCESKELIDKIALVEKLLTELRQNNAINFFGEIVKQRSQQVMPLVALITQKVPTPLWATFGLQPDVLIQNYLQVGQALQHELANFPALESIRVSHVFQQRINEIKELLSAGFKIEDPEFVAYLTCAWSPLHLAASKNDLKMANHLFKNGKPTANLYDLNGLTPLHIVCEKNGTFDLQGKINKAMQEQDVQNETDAHYYDGVISAVVNYSLSEPASDFQKHCKLIENVDPASMNNMDTLLTLTGVSKQTLDVVIASEIAEILITHGADVNKKTNKGMTPLMIASEAGNTLIVKQLIAAKADIEAKDKKGMTALMIASQEGKAPIVEMLLSAKANAHATNNDGCTALMLAQAQNHTDCVVVLKEEEDLTSAAASIGLF